MLTREQKDAYLKSNGSACPYCGSNEIEGGGLESDVGSCWNPVECLECGRCWTDIYELTDIDEGNE